MPLLTIFLLLAACMPIPWPPSPLGLDRTESLYASALAVLVPLTIAFALRTWVIVSLRRDHLRRIEVGRAYLRLRVLLFYFNLGCVLLAVLGLGWGAAMQSYALVKHHGYWTLFPFSELLVPLPYFVLLLGTWLIYYDAERALHMASLNASRPYWSRIGFVLHNLRQLMLFMFLPVVLFATNQSIQRWWPDLGNDVLFRLGSTFAVLGLVILLPVAIRPLLGLMPLPPGPTRTRMMGLSQRLRFRYRDLLMWPTRGGMVNALILGLVPRVRYVIFTDRILDELPPEQLDAVLGHEAGHALHGHIHYYLVFLVLSTFALAAGGMYVEDWLRQSVHIPEEIQDWLLLPPLGVVAVYLFLVFGFLSRRCERQADVHGAWAISCGDPNCTGHTEETIFPQGKWSLCPTGLRTMADALERVQLLNGYGVDHPQGIVRRIYSWFKSWVHGTIPTRIAYLLSLIDHPERERRLQWSVRFLRWGLLAALIATIITFGELVGWAKLAQAM